MSDVEATVLTLEDTPKYSSYEEARIGLITDASRIAPADIISQDKIIPAKNLTVSSFPSADDTVDIFKTMMNLLNDLQKSRFLDKHLSFGNDNPIEGLINELWTKPRKDTSCSDFRKYKKLVLANDAAIFRVILGLLHSSSGYQTLVSNNTYVWALELYQAILVLAGLHTSKTNREPTDKVAERLLYYIHNLSMSETQTDATNNLIYNNLDAYCAEKGRALKFLQMTDKCKFTDISAITVLLNGLPSVFKKEFDLYRETQRLKLNTYDEAVVELLKFQNLHRFTFAKITDGTPTSVDKKIPSELPVISADTPVVPAANQQPVPVVNAAVGHAGGNQKKNRRKENNNKQKQYNNDNGNNNRNQQPHFNNGGRGRGNFQGRGRGFHNYNQFNNGFNNNGGGRGNNFQFNNNGGHNYFQGRGNNFQGGRGGYQGRGNNGFNGGRGGYQGRGGGRGNNYQQNNNNDDYNNNGKRQQDQFDGNWNQNAKRMAQDNRLPFVNDLNGQN